MKVSPYLKKRGTLIIVFLVAVTVAFFFDPINRLNLQLIKYDFTTLGWRNGFWTLERLPASATPEQIAQAYYPKASCKIREVRKAYFGWPLSGPYTAIVVDGPNGEKVLVAEANFADSSWAVRDYDP